MSAEPSQKSVLLLVALSALMLLLSPALGPSGIGVSSEIFWKIRLPRTLLGFLAGAALGGAGLAFQALFRNPLASPFTFGVSSGASFGAVFMMYLGAGSGSYLLASWGGLIGGLLPTLAIYLVARKNHSAAVTLLTGVAMSFVFSSLVVFVQYLSDFNQSFQIVRWLMGGLDVVGYGRILLLLPFVLLGVLPLFYFTAELDAFSLGDELALSRGVDVSRIRVLLFILLSLMIGAVVSFTGPIGFVGIIAPHFCRLLVGPRHRVLVPVVIAVSGSFLVACDAVARAIFAPSEIPVGVITALLGGPFFLFVLVSGGEGEYRRELV